MCRSDWLRQRSSVVATATARRSRSNLVDLYNFIEKPILCCSLFIYFDKNYYRFFFICSYTYCLLLFKASTKSFSEKHRILSFLGNLDS